MKTCTLSLSIVLLFVALADSEAGAPPSPPPSGKPGALIDLEGYWVPVISQDWRWRMVTPPKGDYASVPLNAEGTKVADTWDLQRDNAAGEQCRAFGAPAIMRIPGRMHVTWQDDMTLKLEFDAGTQTRLLHFSTPNSPSLPVTGERTWQGHSVARWFKQAQRRGFTPAVPPSQTPGSGGSLTVETSQLKAGYLRKNGVPYSESVRLTEYFDRFPGPGGTEWLEVTTVVEDPQYLRQRFLVATHFKREPDGSKWNPTPCQTDPPLADKPPPDPNI